MVTSRSGMCLPTELKTLSERRLICSSTAWRRRNDRSDPKPILGGCQLKEELSESGGALP